MPCLVDIPDHAFFEAHNIGWKCSHLAKIWRNNGYRFTDAAFRARWRAVTGIPKKSYQRSQTIQIVDEPAPQGSLPGIVRPVEQADKLEGLEKPMFGGRLRTKDVERKELDGKRFVFTAAQNNTELHDDFWNALQTFCAEKDAQLIVSKFAYNKNGWAYHNGADTTKDDKELWYDPRILPYVLDEQVKVARGLVFCGELDILPTQIFPLTGLDNYTGTNSAIIPHAKMQMRSLATMKHDPAKFLYSTGTVTKRNYIERRAGQVASYHHVYGAIYVEVADDGAWFVRQLNSDDNGLFFDLDRAYGPNWSAPSSQFGRPNVNLGDIHIEKSDPAAMTGAIEMMRTLNPANVFLHDLIDFEARNHHNKKDKFFLVNQQFNRNPSVEAGMAQAAQFLAGLVMLLPDTTFYVVRSNHDVAFKKWLREGAGFIDPPNERYWHEMNAKLLLSIELGSEMDIYKHALELAALKTGVLDQVKKVKFLQEDESLVLNGIEYGMHGHLGCNGARGNPKAFRELGRRANTGHTHSAGIIDGVWTAGVLATLDMGYNQGPSSWSHSNIVTYPNAKRTIITQRGSRWRV